MTIQSSIDDVAAKVRQGDDSFVRQIDEAGWETLRSAKDGDGRTLLHTIAACGRLDILQFLAEKGHMVAVNDQDGAGWTPLMSGARPILKSASAGHQHTERLRESQFVTVYCSAAASAGHEGVAQLLLGAGAKAQSKNLGGQTALHYASSKGHARVAQILIEAGMNAEHSDSPALLFVLPFMALQRPWVAKQPDD
jgi:ankyrin repeat protein